MKLRRLAGVCGQQAYAGMVTITNPITGSLDKGDIVTGIDASLRSLAPPLFSTISLSIYHSYDQ